MKMLRLGGCILLASAGALCFTGCSKESQPTTKADAPTPSPSQSAGKVPDGTPIDAGRYFATPWQDESQYIVTSIITDVAEMAYYAARKEPPKTKEFSVQAVEKTGSAFRAPVYLVTIRWDEKGPIYKTEVPINGPIWSPDVYADLVSQIFRQLNNQPPKAGFTADNAHTPLALVDFTAETIERQNQEISLALGERFDDPLLHERAAFVLGALGLREHTEQYSNLRPLLCRMTAHLALAGQWSKGAPPTITRQLADAVLSTLMENQRDALAKINAIHSTEPGVQSWQRALRARNTHDYREIQAHQASNLLESIELFYALSHSADNSTAWLNLPGKSKQQCADFARIANNTPNSIQAGHELLAVSVPLELNETATVYALTHGKELQKSTLVPALNEPPDRALTGDARTPVHVIGWGQWAGFFQRQLCHALQSDFDFLENRWGVPEEAAKFNQSVEKAFGGLQLYPFVARMNSTSEGQYKQAVEAGFKLTVASPQLVPPSSWNYLCYNVDFAPRYQPVPNPHINEWHKHNPPPGTMYDILPRLNHPSLTERPDTVSILESLHAQAPYDRDLCYNLLQIKYHDAPNYTQAEAVYHELLEFDSISLGRVAQMPDTKPEQAEKLLLRAAEVNPTRYYYLADYLLQHGDEDRAATYYETGMQKCSDAVRAASHSLWLVDYYLRKNLRGKAGKLADEAAQTYSSEGLSTKAHYLEVTGQSDLALNYYRMMEERYNDHDAITSGLYRYQQTTGNRKFANELQARLQKIFPAGLEHVSLADFKNQPADGAVLDGESQYTEKAGLKKNHIIVAVFGIRTRNFNQYVFARNADASTEIPLIAWKGDHYEAITVNLPEHRLDAPMSDYTRH